MNKFESHLYPQVVVKIYSETSQPSNATITDEERKKITTERNRPEKLADIVSRDNPTNVIWEEVRKDGALIGAVQSKWPLQPWMPGALMVAAAPAELLTTPHTVDKNILDAEGRYPVQFLYDAYPFEVQQTYAAHILAGITAMEEATLPSEIHTSGMPHVVGVENAVSTLGAGRTVALPHLQIFKTGLTLEDTDEPQFDPRLLRSQRLQRTYPRRGEVVNQIETVTKNTLNGDGEQLIFSRRELKKPFGYTITTGITKEDIRDDITAASYSFATIMKAHYEANKGVITDEIKQLPEQYQNKILPPYSNYHYFYFSPDEAGRDTFCITISPALFPGAGVENGGKEIRRGNHYPPLFPEEVEILYRKEVGERLEDLLK